MSELIASHYLLFAAVAGGQGVTYELAPKGFNVPSHGNARATERCAVDAKVMSGGDVQVSSQVRECSVTEEGGTWKIDLSNRLSDAFGTALDVGGSLS